MNKTFFSHSFGCRVNQAEKERVDEELLKKGYSCSENDPSLYVINSCSVTHKAEREARQLIYQIKRKSPQTKIVVTGCAATNWIKQGIKVQEVDYVIDNQNKEYLASLIERNVTNTEDALALQKMEAVSGQVAKDKYTTSKRMFIKIQDGCQRFCTFCIVPYLRGLPKSKSIESIVTEIRRIEDKIQEVILVAINTEAFGYDTKEKFIELLNNVINKTIISRLSFGSIHPWSVNEHFFNWYKQNNESDRVVSFFHIPLQSGSNKMLQLMKRGYTRDEFIEKLNTIYTINPMTYIGTDVIVGFLEETDKDFEDTYKFLEQTPISKFHVFRFSKRQHTAAYYLSKRLKEPDSQTKIKRARALAQLGRRKYEMFLTKHIGKNLSALVLERRDGDIQLGLLSNQIPIKIRTEKNLSGKIRNIRINSYKNGELFGRLMK